MVFEYKKVNFFVFSLILLVSFGFSVVNIDACPYQINASGLYSLSGNLNATGSCILVYANEVEVDCLAKSINGSNAGYGIYSNASNTTIKNCNLFNFTANMLFEGASNGMIRNINSTTGNGLDYGIEILSSVNNTIYNCNITSEENGLWVENSLNNTFENITINSTWEAMDYEYSNFSTFKNLFANSSITFSVFFESSYSNNFTDSQFITSSATDESIDMANSSNNRFTRVKIVGNDSEYGTLYMYSESQNNTFINSSILSRGADKVLYLQPFGWIPVSNNTFINNTFSNGTVLLTLGSPNNTFLENSFFGYGIVNDTSTSGNYFNNSSVGNKYYDASGNGYWLFYDIVTSTVPNWANAGFALPFSHSSLGSRWNGSSEDWRPWVGGACVPSVTSITQADLPIVLNCSNTVYTLAEDISFNASGVINVTGTNITFNGNSHRLITNYSTHNRFSTNFIVRNSTIANFTIMTDSAGNGDVYSNNGINVSGKGNLIENVSIHMISNSTALSVEYSEDTRIFNVSVNSTWTGIAAYESNRTKVLNSTVYCTDSGWCQGIVISSLRSLVAGAGVSNDTLIANNHISNIFYLGAFCGIWTQNCYIYNNTIESNAGDGHDIYFEASDSDCAHRGNNGVAENNTLNCTNTTSPCWDNLFTTDGGFDNVTFKNNIVLGNFSKATVLHVAGISSTCPSAHVNVLVDNHSIITDVRYLLGTSNVFNQLYQNVTIIMSNNTIYNKSVFDIDYADELAIPPNITVINNTFYSAINISSISNGTKFINNVIRSSLWVANLGTSNLFNNSTAGNKYYTASGVPAETFCDIYDTNGDSWADIGNDLPFNGSTTCLQNGGTPYWIGDEDWHPWTIYTLSSCGNLSTENTTYKLSINVSVNGTSCFNITAKNVTLNCRGLSIVGNNSYGTYGVFSNASNTTIANCTISNFSEAIRLQSADDGLIITNNLTTTYSAGNNIRITSGSNRTNITQNILSNVASNGIYIDAVENVSIDCRSASINGSGHSATSGIHISSSNTTIKNCNVNNFGGISTFTYQGGAITFEYSDHGTIENTNVSGSAHSDVTFYKCNHSSAIDLYAKSNDAMEFWFDESFNSTLINFTANISGPTGMYFGIFLSNYTNIENVMLLATEEVMIEFTEANYSNMVNVTFGNSEIGVTLNTGYFFLDDSSFHNLTNISISANETYFEFSDHSNANNLLNSNISQVTSSNAFGLIDMYHGASNNSIIKNYIDAGGSSFGIHINTGTNNNFTNNTILDAKIGTYILNSNDSYFLNNIISSESAFFTTGNSQRNIILNNTITTTNFSFYFGATGENNTICLNNITSNLWVNDTSTYGNIFNNSTAGNYWASATNVPLSSIISITSTTATWADGGSQYPLNNSTASTRWFGLSADWHPWSGVLPTSPPGGASSGIDVCPTCGTGGGVSIGGAITNVIQEVSQTIEGIFPGAGVIFEDIAKAIKELYDYLKNGKLFGIPLYWLLIIILLILSFNSLKSKYENERERAVIMFAASAILFIVFVAVGI